MKEKEEDCGLPDAHTLNTTDERSVSATHFITFDPPY
jgi:hypothetical protein